MGSHCSRNHPTATGIFEEAAQRTAGERTRSGLIIAIVAVVHLVRSFFLPSPFFLFIIVNDAIFFYFFVTHSTQSSLHTPPGSREGEQRNYFQERTISNYYSTV